MISVENTNIRFYLCFLFNLAILIMEIIAIFENYHDGGKSIFVFYTVDSNLLALAASTCCCLCSVWSLWQKKTVLPNWCSIFKFTATCCLTVTFLVVLFVLIPSSHGSGFPEMLTQRQLLYHHLLCPLVAIFSFLWIDPDPKLSLTSFGIAWLPTIIYAFTLLILNIIRKVHGPYPFLMIYQQPVYQSILWFLLILSLAAGIVVLFRFLKNVVL